VKQELIPLRAKTDWDYALSHVPHAFGHTWESCRAMHLTTRWDTYLYHLQDRDVHIVCPIAERNYSGYTDIVTPYGFSGFTGNREYPGLQARWRKFTSDRNYICGYIGLNSIIAGKTFHSDHEVFSYNTMYALDLTLSLDQLFKNLSTNRRRQVKNHEYTQETFSQDDSVTRSFFLSNYHHFFADHNASQLSALSIETLSCLIGLENVLSIGKMMNNKIVAVSVFAFSPYIAEYLFNISVPEGRDQTVPLLWQGIRVLREKNIPVLNLGGGVKEGDSLADFKKRFGGTPYPITALKQIYNKEIFGKLCHQAGIKNIDMDGFFPPYHKA